MVLGLVVTGRTERLRYQSFSRKVGAPSIVVPHRTPSLSCTTGHTSCNSLRVTPPTCFILRFHLCLTLRQLFCSMEACSRCEYVEWSYHRLACGTVVAHLRRRLHSGAAVAVGPTPQLWTVSRNEVGSAPDNGWLYHQPRVSPEAPLGMPPGCRGCSSRQLVWRVQAPIADSLHRGPEVMHHAYRRLSCSAIFMHAAPKIR